MTKVSERVTAVDKLSVERVKIIKKKKNCGRKKKIEKWARKMVEWEAEKDSGWESVDSVA